MKLVLTSQEAARPAGSEYFIGEVQVQTLLSPEQDLDLTVVHFSPSAHTYLHAHEKVQAVYCLEGTGILATEHQRHVVTPGMTVHIPADELHWHGAAQDSPFIHLSIRPPGETRWTKIDPLAAR
jgi:quercetin dioxygenase-like cupin family protein